MDSYPFYDALLKIFGVLIIYVSLRKSKKEKVYRSNPILKALGVCFGVFWILLPWIHRKTEGLSCNAAVEIDMFYNMVGIVPAATILIIFVVILYLLVLFRWRNRMWFSQPLRWGAFVINKTWCINMICHLILQKQKNDYAMSKAVQLNYSWRCWVSNPSLKGMHINFYHYRFLFIQIF